MGRLFVPLQEVELPQNLLLTWGYVDRPVDVADPARTAPDRPVRVVALRPEPDVLHLLSLGSVTCASDLERSRYPSDQQNLTEHWRT